MKEKHFNILRWLPVVGSFLLVVLIAVTSAVTLKELKEATFWRRHTFDVILEAQTEEDSFIHAQTHLHNYAMKGSPSLLVEFQGDTNSEMQDLNKLVELTRDNPAQQQQLKELEAAMRTVLENDKRIISVYARQGSAAALKAEDASPDLVDTTIQDLEKVKTGEKVLLEKRDDKEQADYHKAAHLLIISSILAALLLVLVNYFKGRELARRRRAEARQRELIDELQTALAEVKTLSGLIPICGWCKKVRSDQGFWQSVESYVCRHTDAKFSHGMCPQCAEKWEANLTDRQTNLTNSTTPLS